MMKARILIAALAATAILAAPQSASAEKRRARSHPRHSHPHSRPHLRTLPSPQSRAHNHHPHLRTLPHSRTSPQNRIHRTSRRVWVPAVYETRLVEERVWVPAVYETRLVEERVLVRDPCRCGRGCRALHRSYWTVRTVAKRVLVREGHWTVRTVTRRVCVRPGYWKTVRPCGISVRVRVGF